MKKTTLILLSSLLLSTPAWASHEGGKEAHPVHTSAMIKEHFPMAQQRVLELQTLAKRSVELMQQAQKLTEQAQQTKSLATALLAMQAFKAGREVHQENMQAMQKMHEHLMMHVSDHYVGKVVLDAALLQQIQTAATDLKDFMQSHKEFCQKNIKPLNQKMRKHLIALGNELFEKARSAGDTQAMLQAIQLIKIEPGQ